MRLGRLAFLLAVFIGISASAEAQYTSKSTTSSSGFTQSSGTTTQPAARQAVAPTAQARQGNPYTGNSASAAKTTSSYTTGSTSAATQAKTSFTTNSATTSNTSAAQAKPTQAVFRPRPQAAAPEKAPSADEDELPSFEALEGKKGQTAGAAAQNVPPPPPPKGEIWFYIADFAYRDRTGKTMNCDWKVVVQNRTDTEIERLKISYTLLDLLTVADVKKLAPNASKVFNHAFYSPKCPAMSRIKPKLTVAKCKFGPLADQDCAKYLVVK